MSLMADELWIITERLTPLQLIIDSLSPTEICSGLYNIIEALIFLHCKAALCHNNISIDSVFVAESGIWKLGAMEFTCHHTEPSSFNHQVGTASSGCSKDMCDFAQLAVYILEYTSTLGDIITRFEKQLEQMLNQSGSVPAVNDGPAPVHSCVCESSALSQLLDEDLFRNDFIDIINFIRYITVKTDEEKITFFRDVVQRLYNLPVHLVGSRLIRPLLSRFVLLDVTACQHLLPHLLSPYPGTVRQGAFVKDALNPIFPRSLYQRYVLPELFKMFHVYDVHVRCVLLQHFHRYVELFDSQVLSHSILPQLLLGIRDVNDRLVSLSLQALATLVPILGGDVVIGADRKQIFSDGQLKADSNVACELSNGAVHNTSRHEDTKVLQQITDKRWKTEQQIKHEQLQTDKQKSWNDNSSDWRPTSDTYSKQDPSMLDNSIVDNEGWQDDHLSHSLSSCDIAESLNELSHQSVDQQADSPKLRSPTGKCGSPLKFQHPTVNKTTESNSPVVHSAVTSSAAGPVLPVLINTATSAMNISKSMTSKPQPSAGSHYCNSAKVKFSPDQQLGAECDIKQITVKLSTTSGSAVGDEFDYFADMTPRIDSCSKSDSLHVDSLLSYSSRLTDHSVTATQQSSRFAVCDSNNTVSESVNDTGWDVDFDWNSDLH
jgi:SCY1-like protein 3